MNENLAILSFLVVLFGVRCSILVHDFTAFTSAIEDSVAPYLLLDLDPNGNFNFPCDAGVIERKKATPEIIFTVVANGAVFSSTGKGDHCKTVNFAGFSKFNVSGGVFQDLTFRVGTSVFSVSNSTVSRFSMSIAKGVGVLSNLRATPFLVKSPLFSLSSGSKLSLNNCSFTGLKLGSGSSALIVKATNADLFMAKSAVEDCIAGAGGGIVLSNTALNVSHSLFRNFSTVGGGSAVSIRSQVSAPVSITSTTFLDFSGGALYVADAVGPFQLQLTDSVFNRTESGLAISNCNSAAFVVSGCAFNGGGEIVASGFSGTASLRIEGSQFRHVGWNSSDGAVGLSSFTDSASATILDSLWYNCSSFKTPAGILATGFTVSSSITIRRCEFDHLSTLSTLADYGVGLAVKLDSFSYFVKATLDELFVHDCDGPSSGTGVAITNADGFLSFSIANSRFLNLNREVLPLFGSAIYLSDLTGDMMVEIRNITVGNARAMNGGAVFAEKLDTSCSLKIVDCLFQDLVGAEVGGAVALQDVKDGASATLQNCQFLNVTSSQEGGAVHFQNIAAGSSVHVTACNFSDTGLGPTPTLGGAIFIDTLTSSVFEVLQSTFRRSRASQEGGFLQMQNVLAGTIAISKCAMVDGGGVSNGGAMTARRLASSEVALRDSTLEDIDACGFGAAIFGIDMSKETAVTLDNVNITRAGKRVTPTLGGAIMLLDLMEESVASMKRCFLSETRCWQTGGAVMAQNVASLKVEESEFSDCWSGLNGGILYVTDTQAANFSNTRFLNSLTSGGCAGCGGAVHAELSAVTFSGCTFKNLSSVANGGAVLVGVQSRGMFSGCHWTNCKAQSGGGLFAISANVELSLCTFQNCSAFGSGGGVLAIASSVSMESVIVMETSAGVGGVIAAVSCGLISLTEFHTNNTRVLDRGGVLHILDSTVFMKDCSSRRSLAGNDGGAVLLQQGSKATIIRYNTSATQASNGGVLHAVGSECALIGARFFDSTTFTNGGAIFVGSGATIDASDAVIVRGQAINQGGGVHVEGGVFRTSGSEITGCSAYSGGAVSLVGGAWRHASDFASPRLLLSDNRAWTGGAVSADTGSSIVMEKAEVRRCAAGSSGGGVYVKDSSFSFKNVIFEENLAGGGSGGAAFSAKVEGLFSDCTFNRNSAEYQGGGVCSTETSPGGDTCEFTGSVLFSENVALVGGGLFFEGNKPPGLVDVEWRNNSATFQNPDVASDPATLKLLGSLVGVQSRAALGIEVIALDQFGAKCVDTADARVILASNLGSASVMGGTGFLVNGTAKMPQLTIQDTPGTNGSLLLTAEAFRISATVNYSLSPCTVGQIQKPLECVSCDFGTFAVTSNVTSCSPCPANAVCFNGSHVDAEWNHWLLPGEVQDVWECAVVDACLGVASLTVVLEDQSDTLLYVSDGCTEAIQTAVVAGMAGLVGEAQWVMVSSLLCSKNGTGSLRVTSKAPLVISTRKATLRVFAGPGCAEGYAGVLCSRCSEGFGKSKQACKRCLSPVWSIILSAGLALVFVAVVCALVHLTTKSVKENNGTSLVALGKVLFSYFQLMSLCAHLPLQWPSPIVTLFQVQETAASINSFQFVSLDCFLAALGISGGSISLRGHALVVFLLPPLFIGLTALFWRSRPRGKGVLSRTDRFFITVLTILFLSYPSLSKNALSLLPCRDLGSNRSFMSHDLDVSCQSSAYGLSLALGLTGTVLYAVGIPLLSFLLVYRQREQLETDYTRHSVGFLYIGYSSECWWYESVVLVKKTTMVFIILLCGTVDSRLVGTLSVILFVCSYILQSELKPFERPEVDRLERMASIGLISMLLCGSVFSEGSDIGSAARDIIILFLLGYNLLVLAVAIVLAAPSLRKGREKSNPLLEKLEMSNSSLAALPGRSDGAKGRI